MADVNNYPRQSYFRATLSTAIDAVQTADIFLSETLDFTIASTVYLNVLDPLNVETMSCTGQQPSGELTGVTRAVATYEGETATAHAHGAGVTVILSDDWNYWKDMVTGLNDKVDIAGDTMTGPLKFSGDTNAGIEPNRLTTAQRLALVLTGTETAIVFDTDLGQYFTWNGSTWAEVSTGTAPAFASETVAGVVELATAAQSGAATSTGETGARLVMPNSLNVTTSVGAADAGKNPVLNAGGILDPTIVNAQVTSTANAVVRGDGDGKIDNGWINNPSYTEGLDAAETIDGTTTPAVVYIDSDGKLAKADASFTDNRSSVAGVVLNSTTLDNPADLLTEGVLTVPSVTTEQTFAQEISMNADSTNSDTLFTFNQAADRFSQLFMVPDQAANITQISIECDNTGASRSFVMDIFATDSDGLPTGASLATSDVLAISGGASEYKNFVFSTPLDVSPGDILNFVISTSGTAPDGSNELLILTASTDYDYTYNIVKQGSTSGYADSSWSDNNGGGFTARDASPSFRIYSTKRVSQYGDPVFLSETAGEYSMFYPTGTASVINSIGTLLNDTEIELSQGKAYKFLGSSTIAAASLSNTSANKKFTIPPRAQMARVYAGTSLVGEITRKESGDGSLSWASGVVTISGANANTSHSIYFYGY